MGNYCDNNFQNIRDNEIVVSQVQPVGRRGPLSRSGVSSEHYQQNLNEPKPIDQEAIHSIYRKQEPVVELPQEQDDSRSVFPMQPEVVSMTSAPKRHRKLQQLDLSFYHSLGLPDYEYLPIPETDKELFNGVQTYQLKDNYGVKYVGQWLNNHIHGNGVLMSNTSKYIGQFKFGLKHYHGRQIMRHQVYEGEFEGGRRKGLGVRYTPTLTERGEFEDQLINGEIIYLDGRVEERRLKKSNINLMEDLKQNEKDYKTQNRSVNSLFTDKYYEASELPSEWYEEDERKAIKIAKGQSGLESNKQFSFGKQSND